MIDLDFYFIHIEKCMGSSFRIILYNYFKHFYNKTQIYLPEKYKVYINFMNKVHYNEISKMLDIKKLKILLSHSNFNQKNLTDKFSKTAFSITCVREPIKRFISHYYFFIYPNNKTIISELPKHKLVAYILEISNVLTIRLAGGKNEYNTAIDNLKYINCIIIMEQIDRDLLLLNSMLNRKLSTNNLLQNIVKNESKIKSLCCDYNIVLEYNYLFKNDIKLYNHICYLNDNERFKFTKFNK
jgi:hypothetical protein